LLLPAVAKVPLKILETKFVAARYQVTVEQNGRIALKALGEHRVLASGETP
jgi:hypothetical protein